jgi:hypothetical protein
MYDTTLGGEPLTLSRQILSHDEVQFTHECKEEIFLIAQRFLDPMQVVTYQGAKAKL